MRPITSVALALIVTLAGCCAPGGGGPGGMGRGGPGGGPGGGPMADPRGEGGPRSVSASGGDYVRDKLQDQLSELAIQLHLTPLQQPLWELYQSKVGALMADQLRINLDQSIQRTALQQINARVDTVRNRLTAMEEIAEAARQLYASLNDEQKAVANQRLASTVPALYSGLGDLMMSAQPTGRAGPGGGPGGGGPGGMGGGMGGRPPG